VNHIVQVRGCSGAGKSTLLRQLVREHSVEAIHEAPARSSGGSTYRLPIAYRCPGADGTDLFVVGRYHAEKGGGLDGVEPIDQQMLIGHFEQWGPVVHESLMTSAGGVDTGGWFEWRSKWGDKYHFVYLDTPADVAIARVYQRNGGKPIKEDQVRSHQRTVLRSAQRLIDRGDSVAFVPHEAPYPELLNLLKGWCWEPKRFVF